MRLDHEQKYIFTLEEVLSEEECQSLIERIEREKPEVAPIITPRGTQVRLDVRNNERVMFDDVELAEEMFNRVKEHLPAEIHGMHLCGVNERFRCYRYKPGMRFAPHADGPFIRNSGEQSWYTYIVYLNSDFEGGNTTFLVEPEVSIEPAAGRALFFQHPLIHEGCLVTSGVKYALRTDVMYRRQMDHN